VIRFRPEVTVETAVDSAEVGFAHWNTRVPLGSPEPSDAFRRLLVERCVDPSGLSVGEQAFVSLLRAQGCFLPQVGAQCEPGVVIDYFRPLKSHLYAEYQAHPLWERIRRGDATRGELTAWVIQNYHISRSAGPIAARMSVRASRHELREFFREDALEEYWHCDAFYFVDGLDISVAPEQIKTYVSLPSSTAFEDLALLTAEQDWLGHLLIAYFQESSIIFRSDTEEFYDLVEQQYGLQGLFRGWRRHMTLDIDEGHADGLARVFSAGPVVTLQEMQRSFRRVQLAHFYLSSALDQVAHQPADVLEAVRCRLPVALDEKQFSPRALSARDTEDLLHALREASFRALAFAKKHDEMIAAGRLAADLGTLTLDGDIDRFASSNPWTVAAGNFIVEHGLDVPACLTLGSTLVQWIKQDDSRGRDLERSLEWLHHFRSSAHKTEIAQLNEFLCLVTDGVVLDPLVIGEPAAAP
jgi:hypothetical protein